MNHKRLTVGGQITFSFLMVSICLTVVGRLVLMGYHKDPNWDGPLLVSFFVGTVFVIIYLLICLGVFWIAGWAYEKITGETS